MPLEPPERSVCSSTAKRRAYGRSGLATSAKRLAPKKNQQNYNWQWYAQQPKQCAASQSHCFSPSSLMLSDTIFVAGKRPCWILVPRAKKFLRTARPTGPRREDRARPNQSLATGGAARGEGARREGRQTHRLSSTGQKIEGLMASAYIRPSKTRINTITSTRPRPPPP